MKIIYSLLLCFSLQLQASEGGQAATRIIYKYKRYESFDLGNLQIKGNIIAPGDLSVKERDRKRFNRSLLEKDNFDRELILDIKNLR